MIPDAAVEAAAKTGYEARHGWGWSDLDAATRDAEIFAARFALEAAAPHMLVDLLNKLDAVRALVYDDTLANGLVMRAINPEAIRDVLDRKAAA